MASVAEKHTRALDRAKQLEDIRESDRGNVRAIMTLTHMEWGTAVSNAMMDAGLMKFQPGTGLKMLSSRTASMKLGDVALELVERRAESLRKSIASRALSGTNPSR